MDVQKLDPIPVERRLVIDCSRNNTNDLDYRVGKAFINWIKIKAGEFTYTAIGEQLTQNSYAVKMNDKLLIVYVIEKNGKSHLQYKDVTNLVNSVFSNTFELTKAPVSRQSYRRSSPSYYASMWPTRRLSSGLTKTAVRPAPDSVKDPLPPSYAPPSYAQSQKPVKHSPVKEEAPPTYEASIAKDAVPPSGAAPQAEFTPDALVSAPPPAYQQSAS